MSLVAGSEEPLGSTEQAIAVIPPTDAVARLESFGEARLVGENRCDRIKAARHVYGTVLVRQNRGLLRTERERPGRRIVTDEAGGRLCCEPLSHVPLPRLRMPREIL